MGDFKTFASSRHDVMIVTQVEMETTGGNNREPRDCNCENQANLCSKKFPFQSQAVGNLAVEWTRHSVPDKWQGSEKSLKKERDA